MRRVEKSAVLRCPSCGAHRTVGARNARRIRSGQTSGICATCRTAATVHVGGEEREWARLTLAAMTVEDRALVAIAFEENT